MAGGNTCRTVPTALSSIIIYDYPFTGRGERVGNLVYARDDHAAILLQDGRLFVVGGQRPDGQGISEIEIYDPKTRKSRLAGRLISPRCMPVVTELQDGNVLIAGGFSPFPFSQWGEHMSTGAPRDLVASLELYNLRTEKSRVVAAFREARFSEDATILKDGRVLFTGGVNAQGKHLNRNEIYDPAKHAIAAVGSMNVERFYESIVALSNGDALFAGGIGRNSENAIQSAELFDARAGTFHLVGDLIEPTVGPATALLKDGRVLLAGGAFSWSPRTASSAVVQIYDPHARVFVSAGHLTTPRTSAAAELRPDGTVLIKGGYGYTLHAGGPLSTAEIYDPARGRSSPVPWSATTSLSQ